MDKIISFRTKVFKRATQIRLETDKKFDVCLMISWRVYHLIQRMKKGEVRFAYEKKEDGSLRYAIGTLKGIPDGTIKSGEFRDRDWHRHYKTIPYFDVEAQEFRSFKAQNFIRAYDEDAPSTKTSGINIEISGDEGDGSLSTANLLIRMLKEKGITVLFNIPQEDVAVDYGIINTKFTVDAMSERIIKGKTVVNVTYMRKRKHKKKDTNEKGL